MTGGSRRVSVGGKRTFIRQTTTSGLPLRKAYRCVSSIICSLRYAILIVIWIFLFSYLWIYNRSACEQGNSGPLKSQFRDLQVSKSQDIADSKPSPIVPPASSEDATVVEPIAVTLPDVYLKKWVGFQEIIGHNCKEALSGKTNNSFFPQVVKRTWPPRYITDSNNCMSFRIKHGFMRYPRASEEEKDFPIAFIILFNKDLDQVLFLLRALYHPHNVYCLSVDTKASVEFLQAVRSVANCLPNVFVASKLENIVYAGFSRLMADIDCMQDLLKHPVQWKYVINMPGQQFPLRTNLEMVKILTLYNGGNDIEGLIGDMLLKDRYEYEHADIVDEQTGEIRVKKLFIPNDPPPHGLDMLKGSTYGTFSRDFVKYALNDPIAKDFLQWCKTIKSPDEYFWGTLHHTKKFKVPGGFRGAPDKKPWLTSFSLWETNPHVKCATMYVHKICIISPEDFHSFIQKGPLFANKFYVTHHPAALHCLDEMMVNLTHSRKARDLSFYKDLPFSLKT